MTKGKYARVPALPPMKRPTQAKPFARRCGSGEYDVMLDGLMLSGGFDNREEAEQWIEENYK